MTTKTEGRHPGEFIIVEEPGTRSREKVTIASGQDLEAGRVVGKITSGGKYAAYDNDAGDGTEVAAGILLYAVDASGGDAEGVIIARDAEINGECLEWGSPDEITAGIADLLSLGIVVRSNLTS